MSKKPIISLRFSQYRNIEELLLKCAVKIGYSFFNLLFLKYASLIKKCLRNFRKSPCDFVCIDGIYIKVEAEWKYVDQVIDQHSAFIGCLRYHQAMYGNRALLDLRHKHRK